MTTTQYIGARYVPVFADPAEWNNTRTYEPLTIVTHNGNSYTSAQYVPKGIDISNEKYWALTGNYNAQIEAYRKEVQAYDGKITQNAKDIAAEATNRIAADSTLTTNLNAEIARSTKRESEIEAEVSKVSKVASEKKNKTIGVYVGNSYTDGVGSGTSTGVFALTKFLFDEAYKYTEGGAGFSTYVNHSRTFNDLLNDASNDSSFDNTNVTAIIFTSAMGDTRALCEISENKLITNIQNVCTNAKNLFPNAKLYLHFAESVYGRDVQKAYSEDYTYLQYRVHAVFENMKARYSNLIYLGWTGWNTNQVAGFNADDNYHPNANGYLKIVGNFLSSLHGNAYTKRTWDLQIADKNYIKIIAFSPTTAYVKLTAIPKAVFGDVSVIEDSVIISALQTITETTGFYGVLSNVIFAARLTDSKTALFYINTSHDSSTGVVNLVIKPLKNYDISDASENLFTAPNVIQFNVN